MRVVKSGWKTGVSEGRVAVVAGTGMLSERLADCPSDYLFAAIGDSGAVWVDAGTHAPVALHKR
jgi:hypothetical protein